MKAVKHGDRVWVEDARHGRKRRVIGTVYHVHKPPRGRPRVIYVTLPEGIGVAFPIRRITPLKKGKK